MCSLIWRMNAHRHFLGLLGSLLIATCCCPTMAALDDVGWPIEDLPASQGVILFASLSNDADGHARASLKFFDVASQIIHPVPIPDLPVYGAAYSPDEKQIALVTSAEDTLTPDTTGRVLSAAKLFLLSIADYSLKELTTLEAKKNTIFMDLKWPSNQRIQITSYRAVAEPKKWGPQIKESFVALYDLTGRRTRFEVFAANERKVFSDDYMVSINTEMVPKDPQSLVPCMPEAPTVFVSDGMIIHSFYLEDRKSHNRICIFRRHIPYAMDCMSVKGGLVYICMYEHNGSFVFGLNSEMYKVVPSKKVLQRLPRLPFSVNGSFLSMAFKKSISGPD